MIHVDDKLSRSSLQGAEIPAIPCHRRTWFLNWTTSAERISSQRKKLGTPAHLPDGSRFDIEMVGPSLVNGWRKGVASFK